MTFHEKTRWLSLGADLLVWSWYFSQVYQALATRTADESRFFWLMVGVIIATVVILVAGIIAIAIHRPSEADVALDERDRAITRKAGASAYTLLSLGLVLVIGGSFTGWDKFVTINALLLAFIVAELSRYAIEIIGYRRGAV